MTTTTSINALLDEARAQLADKPYDAAHDLGHHLEVMARALELAHQLDNGADVDALRLAVMWHHLPLDEQGQKNSKQTVDALQKKMVESNFRPEFSEKVIQAVSAYALDQQPTSLEGKILYDADKLELLNSNRWQRYATAVERGQISQEKAKKDFNQLADTYKVLRGKLHFEQSKLLFDKLATKFRENSSLRAVFTSYGASL